MLQSVYNILWDALFADFTVSAGIAELVCTSVSTLAVLFILAVPFILVWKVISLICGR